MASVSNDVLTSTLRDNLKEVILDYTGATVGGSENANSTESIHNGALRLGSKGECSVLTKGKEYSTPYAALPNVTFAYLMDFDDNPRRRKSALWRDSDFSCLDSSRARRFGGHGELLAGHGSRL